MALLGLSVVFVYAATSFPGAAILLPDVTATWMAEDRPVRGDSVAWLIGEDPVVVFERSIPREALPAVIEVRALRSFALELDGRELARGSEADWKSWTPVPLKRADGQVSESSRLVIRVRNPLGPGLLQVRRADGVHPDLLPVALLGVAGWTVSADGRAPSAAVVADDTHRDVRALTTPRAADAWANKAAVIACFFAVFAAGSFWLRRPEGEELLRRLIRAAPWALAVVWLGLLVKAFRLPAHMGFDGPDHLAYVRFLLDQRALPIATDGPAMYHPPLFYAASAGLVAVLGRGWESIALHIVPFASGIALVLLAGALARVIHPGSAPEDRLRSGLAAACVGLLPMNLYMASYFSNEGLHAALAACAIWLVARQIVAERIDRRQLTVAGLVIGLAVLTKATSLVYVPIFCIFIAFKARLIDREGWGATLGLTALLLASCAGVSAWFFLRNQLVLGQALIGNWSVPGSGFTWWQQPGFHTLGYYTQFGDAIARPFFSASHSFFDGMYSTFWGDGLIGGITQWRSRHAGWNYDYMTIAFGLALPATLLGIVGSLRSVAASFAGEDLRRRLALSFLVSTAIATAAVLLLLNWLHPAYGMTKAFYALAVSGPVALFGAEGILWGDRFLAERGSWARVPYHAWAATLAVVIVLAFLA